MAWKFVQYLAGKFRTTDASEVQSDWTQNDSDEPSYIKNKPGNFTGATSQSNGAAGFVPAPTTADRANFLCGNGAWMPAGGGGGGSSHNYSTSEQVVGTWIDGKPVYEKTIYYAGGENGTISVPHGISNFKRHISLDATASDSAGASFMAQYTLARISSDGVNVGISSVTDSAIVYYVPSAFGSRIVDLYFVIRYLKTTD
ncbi:MAG: hypothetical protein J5787_05770 [Alphaproteobacteria bacterium]|nr:hypothetical protein [Alphaproteobacteria bacterium]